MKQVDQQSCPKLSLTEASTFYSKNQISRLATEPQQQIPSLTIINKGSINYQQTAKHLMQQINKFHDHQPKEEKNQRKHLITKLNLGLMTSRLQNNHYLPANMLQTARESSKKIQLNETSPKFKKKSNPNIIKRKMFKSEDFNVFFAPLTKKPDQALLNQYKNIYKTSQATINNIQEEIDKILVNKNKKHPDPIAQIKGFLSNISSSVRQLKVMGLEMGEYKCDKNEMEKAIQGLTLESQTIKNIIFPDIQIITLITFAKVEQLYKSTQQAIILFKKAKRLADCEGFYHHKMRCYRGLGELMLQLRPNLAQLYLTKYLVSSWKLQAKADELKAYELLGKFFYYTGNMEKARMFHTRMMEGVCEPDSSGTKKLAVSKLQSGSLGFVRRININAEEEEDAYFNVSSDDEIQEIIFLKEYNEEASPQQLFTKVTMQNHGIREMPKFDAKNNYRKVQQEFNSGNKNIRIQNPIFQSQLNGDLRPPVSKPNQNLGIVRDVVMMSHLSPSRQLGIYQTLESKRPCHSRFQNTFLNSYNDNWELAKVSRQLQKYTTMLQYLEQWLNQSTFKLNLGEELGRSPREQASPRRRGYFVY